jgi:L-lactate utilization protein LutB
MYDSHITDDQRKAFADLIKEAQKRFESGFDEYVGSLKNELTPKLEAKSRTRSLMETVRNLRGKLSEALTGLRKMGFHVDEGLISIDYDNRDDVRRELEEVKRSAFEERDKSLTKFRKAIFSVWSAQNGDEARKIVEEVL